MHDFSRFFEECNRAPRLNELAKFFSATAAGRSGMPICRPKLDLRLLPTSPLMEEFVELHARRQGPFDQHYLSSIPYRYEEECRLGCAILEYAASIVKPLLFYSLGTAEGTMARTMSELAEGKIKTLSCSPNIENQRSFHAYGTPEHAYFFLGPFHHLTPEVIVEDTQLRIFRNGFDFVLEDTTFQMYSPNRRDQLAFVSRHLKPNGILLLVEKFRRENSEEYERREFQKDFGFKARYFSDAQIKIKAKTVLSRMNENEVTLQEIGALLGEHFQHCYATWNSGNFYTIVASNSGQNIDRFISKLGPPALPAEYVYDKLPLKL